MASRRTALPRGTRANGASSVASTSSTASGSRPRPVAAKANGSSQRSTPADDASEFSHPPSRASRPQTVHAAHDNSESNIQVVIRCRRRSDREIQDNSPLIVSTTGAKGQDITIETGSPVSMLGVVTLPPTRTYPFDLVFGPEADQAMIYHDVVSPMLDEVLQGYNCTLFAYGQTGTGKTYTMQGDLTPTPMGNPSGQAGMIPRVLFRLFHQLETSVPDYSVKISYVELYNEELRDLLAPELAAPIGTTQPMGMGSKDPGGQGALKIFDDASKKGVFIQGLEECGVKDAADALALLTKGSQRRQIAATKFNDHSSRSHSVFSITVHTKETSTMGEDLLRVGKMNLVDLAGSENIGRSGAENKRAREAGMINQSLLTLGRVINALVDRSSHVPYRESKLTRLLQDSLGGRTKTCIIATISPARSNMEETLSTLDYAIRAKSIRNKPEVNQRMTRNALLKEYVAEIERLKADVLAAREKNGIFFSEETWQQMSAEQELKDTEVQESKKQIEIMESQLRNVREEFEQAIALLMRRDGELKETKDKLQKKEVELQMTEGELKEVKGALEEEAVVRQAYADNESALDGVANGLKTVAHQSLGDLTRLFGKLERKTTVFTSNVQAVNTHTRKIGSEARELSSKLDDFFKGSNQHLANIRTEAEQYKTKELESLAAVSTRIGQQMEKMMQSLKTIRAKEKSSDQAVEQIHTVVQGIQDDVKTAFGTWADTLRDQCDKTCKEAEVTAAASCLSVEKAFKSLASITETVVQEAQDYITAERKSLQEAKAMAETTAKAEVTRLQQQNAQFMHLLESQKAKSERLRDELLKSISGQFKSFTLEQDRGWREAVAEMTESNSTAEAGMVKMRNEQSRRLDVVMNKGSEWNTTLEKRAGEGKRLRDGGFKAIGNSNAAFSESLTGVRSSVSNSISTFTTDLQRQLQSSDAAYTEAYEDLSRAKRARLDSTEAMATDAQSGFRFMQRGIGSTSRNAELVANQVLSETSGLSRTTETFRTGATKHLSEIYQNTQTLSDHGAREDMPTGTTPRKRSWHFADEWSLTQSREVILRDWRRRGSVSSRSESALSDHPISEEPALEAETGSAAEDDADAMSQADEQDETITMNSPLPIKSLASSTSSSSSLSSIPVAPPKGIKKSLGTLKSGLPTRGTLTERPTNVLAGRPPSRRTRT